MIFEQVRNIALSLPEVEESTSYGTPAFKIRKKQILRLLEDSERVVINCSELYRYALVKENPDAFSIPPHYQNYDLVVVRLETVDTKEFRELLTESWRVVAPKELVEQNLTNKG
jgi:hypothetical protein